MLYQSMKADVNQADRFDVQGAAKAWKALGRELRLEYIREHWERLKKWGREWQKDR